MMSEELFDKSKDNQIRQNCLIMTTDEVVDLLNSQSKLISAYQYEFVKMRKENEQLKSTIIHLEEECGARENDYMNLKQQLDKIPPRIKEIWLNG